MYTSLDTQGRLSARLLSAQARSACLFFLLLLLFYSQGAYAHGVAEGDKGYIQEITGVNIIPFIYLGAKHMVTGYDHLLFLFGVIFFLYKMRDIGLYVSLFAIPQSGHAGHHQTDHFHETPEQPPSVEISLSPVTDRWLPLADLRSPVKATDIIYRPPSIRQI
ncbi:TPA: HupE/UreJ family protein [Enterobacter asburiae]|nr:HupE/UreJ family protein [Enterobacter asburiae]